MDKASIRPDKTKWYKTRKCGCGECRFFSHEERGDCPLINEPTAIWLWASDPQMVGCKDYIDPQDFLPPISYIEKVEPEENVEQNT